eukprot:SAG31_NODE_19005_length_615_cov_0.596899_2_plen_69_part_01
MDRGDIDSEPDRKFGRSRSGGQVRDDLARMAGIVDLKRLNSADASSAAVASYMSPRPATATPLKTSSVQ